MSHAGAIEEARAKLASVRDACDAAKASLRALRSEAAPPPARGDASAHPAV